MIMADSYECGLPLDAPPDGLKPSVDEPPGLEVLAMVRYGEDPGWRRIERVGASWDCWVVRGTSVAQSSRIGLVLHWAEVGYCGHDYEHAMVAVSEDLAEEA